VLLSGCSRLTEPIAVDGGAMLIVECSSCDDVEALVDVVAGRVGQCSGGCERLPS
jgi:hypothetical protein